MASKTVISALSARSVGARCNIWVSLNRGLIILFLFLLLLFGMIITITIIILSLLFYRCELIKVNRELKVVVN